MPGAGGVSGSFSAPMPKPAPGEMAQGAAAARLAEADAMHASALARANGASPLGKGPAMVAPRPKAKPGMPEAPQQPPQASGVAKGAGLPALGKMKALASQLMQTGGPPGMRGSV